MNFELKSPFEPAGDQPQAIANLVAGIREGRTFQVLRGATGTGKTCTLANVVYAVQRPTIVLVHNKLLVRQLTKEFAKFFPKNEVHTFQSCFDDFRPETYVLNRKQYVEQGGTVNREILRERLMALRAVLTRSDTIVVASASALYGLPSPEVYRSTALRTRVGQYMTRDEMVSELIGRQYRRADLKFVPGTFRLRGSTVDIFPVDMHHPCRIVFSEGKIQQLTIFRIVEGDVLESPEEFLLFAMNFSGVPANRLEAGVAAIEKEREERVAKLKQSNRPKLAERLDRMVQADLAAVRRTGTCNGIHNYRLHFENREPGTPPPTLIDYFPADFLTIIDESHSTISQIQNASAGPRTNKQSLVRNGFRLPSAADNRPLTLDEFEARIGPVIYVSATPGRYELEKAGGNTVEQLVRPTFIIDPVVEVVPIVNHADHLLQQIHKRIANGERTLVVASTERHAEELATSIRKADIPCGWLHQHLKGNAREDQLRWLRQGNLNVLVGVNLLREGIDLPQASLVAILDADKGGFLRSERSLIQIIGRAARHVNGKVILYGSRTTDAMRGAIDETNRRREKQLAFNRDNGKTPRSLQNDPNGSNR